MSAHTRVPLADAPRAAERGQLRIFLGAAPGVGKTFAMLQAAHAQLQQALDVRVGVVETHNRTQTDALLVGLAQQPLKRFDSAGTTLFEMDLGGILERPPRLVLVDDLAHENAPGSRHAKRWQDVQELLSAGIDVFATVNVYHLESLNDQVREITGVRVRDTVPDWILQESDEIVLVDLPVRELAERLRDAMSFVPDRTGIVFDAFFSPTNLTVLRELAMRTAAAQIDADLSKRYRQQGMDAPTVRGRLVLGIDGDIQAERLVRHACRVADRRNMPWSVVHVDIGSERDEERLGRLQAAQRLAERLGGEVVSLRGGSVAETLIEHAHARRASMLLVGCSRTGLRRRLHLGRSVAQRLLASGTGLEICVLDAPTERAASPRQLPTAIRWREYLLAPIAVALAAPIALALSRLLELPNISLIFLAAVLVVAVRSSLGPALACAGLSFLAYNLLFLEPLMSLKIHRQQDVLTLLFFLLMAALTGNLASRQRTQLQALRQTQSETAALLDLSRKLTAASDRQAVLDVTSQHFSHWPDVEVSLQAPGAHGIWQVEAGLDRPLSEQERAAADWSWQHDQPSGLGTETLPHGRWWWWPLSNGDGPLVLLGVTPRNGRPLPPEMRRLIAALGQPVAQALTRSQLAQALEAARLHGRTEELRSALLASVSHDLRTPLTAMRGSIDSLLMLGDQIPPTDRRELLEGTRDEAERLDRYIQNLLDMTRLGHGGLKLARDWVAPVDIVAGALQRLRPVLAPLQVDVKVPEELPLLYVHAALIEQALVNVLENAARFSPSKGRMEVRVDVDENELRIRVADQGPGIPKDERERIFDMFYTAGRGDRGGQGTGLGLAICQGMLGAHGGRVTVGEGLEGLGASLTLHLPLHPQPQMDDDRS